MKNNWHAGHRQRLRRRAQDEGLSHFNDHQILEFILFYAIPRADTNEIAHRLLAQFGRLSAVFDARMSDLCQITGVGENAALLLQSMPSLMRRYHQDRLLRDAPVLDNADAVAQYLTPLMSGRSREVFYVLCLDTQLRVNYAAKIAIGTVQSAYVHPRVVVEAVLAHHASAVILAHNHPSGNCTPSSADHQLTRQLVRALNAIEIKVVDHVIIADDKSFSFAEHGVMPEEN